MAIVAWLAGLVALFVVVMIFYIFVPIVNTHLIDTIQSTTANLPGNSTFVAGSNIIKIAFPLAIFVLILGILVYMAIATQQREPHTDVI